MIFDPLYFLFIAPGLILALIAQGLVRYAYSRFSKEDAGSGLTGMQAAEKINNDENFGVKFISTPGELNDYFDPTKDIVNISSDNVNSSSVANIAIVAHEFGHVQQKAVGQNLFRLRTLLVPAVNFGSGIGFVLIAIGLGINALGLVNVGIVLFALTTLFSLITLPIEIDASRRGMALIRKYGLITESKIGGAKWVLAAAALTYFAGLLQSIGQLAYYILLAQGRRD